MKNNGKPEIYFSPTIKSPAGSSLFAKLDEPDVFKGGEPTWKITVVFDPNDAEFVSLKEAVQAFAADYSSKIGKPVSADAVFRPDKNTGQPSITFKSKARQGDDGKFIPLQVVDAAKQSTTEPWNGDTVRVAFRMGGWSSAFGSGIKMYLSAVQVIERRPKSSGGFNAVNVFDDAPAIETPF